MVDFPGNVKNAVNKRIADDSIQQFQINEFTVSCKELNLKRAILVHESNFTLYEGEYRGSVVAVKVVAVEETQQISNYIDAVVDLTSFASLSHDNISSFLGAGYTLNSDNKLREIMIVTEPYERGTMRSLLKKSLDWQTKIILARDVARAISYLHDKSVIHGDIRISTIMVNDQNQAKVVDFAHLCGERSRLETRTFNTSKGTVALSPEMARNHMYDFAADVYAFGMLLFELITEIPPNKNFRYRNAHGGFALLESELRAAVKPGCPAALEALAYSCCEIKALRRVVAPQIVEELDFILIELNRKPEDEVRPSPLRRASSMTNKYAHLLLPSPGSMKQLLPGKAAAVEVESAVSAPAVGENIESSQQAPAVGDTPTPGVQEKSDSEGDAAMLSVPVPVPVSVAMAVPETSEVNAAQPNDDHVAPVVGPSKVPQRRTALPVTPAPRVNDSPSVSVGKSVVPPSSPSVSSENVASQNLPAEIPDGDINVTSAEPGGLPVSTADKKNRRRKGMFDASTAQTEDEVLLPPQPVDSLSPPTTTIETTQTAPDNISGVQALPDNTESDAWLGSESELTVVKEEAEAVDPQPESMGASTTTLAGPIAPAVSSLPAEETPDKKKKKSRTRVKIDYAATTEGFALTESAELFPLKIVESAAAEHVDVVRPPAAASSSSSTMPGEQAKETTTQADVVSVRFELPSPPLVVPVSAIPAAGNPSPTTAPPPAESKGSVASTGLAASSPLAVPALPPVIPAAPTVLSEQTVAPANTLPTEDEIETNLKTKGTQQEAPLASAYRAPPPVPVFSAPPPAQPTPVLATTDPAFTATAPVRAELPDPVPHSAGVNLPSAVSISQPPLVDAESRLFTVYAQPSFGSEYVSLTSFSQDLQSTTSAETEPAPVATSVATVSLPVSSPAPPLLSQFAIYSTSAAPVHGQEHAPAASTKAVRAGAGRWAPPDLQPVPIPASIRALGEPPNESAGSAEPVNATPVVAEKTMVESAQQRRKPNIVPEPFKQHIRAIVETPERKKPTSAVDRHSSKSVEPKALVLSTPQTDKTTHPTNHFTDIFSPLSPPPSAIPASASVAAVATPPAAAEGKVLSKKKSRSRNKLEAKTLTPIGSFMLSPSPAATVETGASEAVSLPAPQAPPLPQPLSVETASLFASPAEKNDDSTSPKPLSSSQKRRQNRAQARAAAAAFATVATAAQEIVEGGPNKHSASASSSAQESPQAEKANFSMPIEALEEPAIVVFTPTYAPPPAPVESASVSSSAAKSDAADSIDHHQVEKKESVPKTEFHSPPRYSATHLHNSSAATAMETPPAKANHSPSRTPNGSLPVPAPHRHIHHFDLPSPQVTPPMHFPLAGAASLVPLPTPPESPCSPLPHKLEPAEALQTVFSDADVKIATGSPQAKAGTQTQHAHSTPHRTVEKLNRFNEFAAAELGSHHKILRTKVLSPAAASQKAVLSAPAPVVTAPVVNAYEERLLMMEQRLQALAEENLALQRELQAAVTRPPVAVVQPPAVKVAPLTADDIDSATSSTASAAAHQHDDVGSESETETVTETESEVEVMQEEEEESHSEAAQPARAPARSSFGAMFRDFDETTSELVPSSYFLAMQSSETPAVSESKSMPVTASFTQELPTMSVVSVVPAPVSLPSAAPIGMVNALKSLEAMQTELRSQLTALNAPPTVSAATTATSAPSAATVLERSGGETQAISLPVDKDFEAEGAKKAQALEAMLTQVVDNSAIGDATPTKSSPVNAALSTPAPQESTPAVVASTPSAAEAEQQLQAHIASAIDSKLGAVQAQIAQFSSMLNAILLAQSPQPHRAEPGDDASQVNCPSSTHTSAFVTPSSIITVGSIALGLENDEDGPGGSPSGSALNPQKLFSQIDQQPVFENVSPLAQKCSSDPGFSEAPVLLRPSDTLQSAAVVLETSSFVPNSQEVWTTLDAPLSVGSDDQRSHTLEPFSPTSNQGNDSEVALSEGEESESEDIDGQEEGDNREETTQDAEEVEVLTHKPSFIVSTSAASGVETFNERPVVSEDEVENPSPLASPVALSKPPPPPSPPMSSPAALLAALQSSPATKVPSIQAVLEPLEEIVEPADDHEFQHNTSNSAAVGTTLSGIIPQLMLAEEEPLEAWEIKARRASTTAAMEMPHQRPATNNVQNEARVSVASPPHSERKPSVKGASEPLTAAAEPASSAMPDKIAPAGIFIPVAASGPSGRAPTPESRPTSPFLRNRIPYPVEAEEKAPLHFPPLYGAPEDEPDETPTEEKSVPAVEEEKVDIESALPSGPDNDVSFSSSFAELIPIGLRESMNFFPPPPEEMHSPAVSVGSRSTGESSSVVDATDIEYPYSAEEYAPSHRTPPQQTLLSGQNDARRSLTEPLPLPQTQSSAAVLALHRHHEQQQRELLQQQEEQLQAELAVFDHHPDPSTHLIPNAHHQNVYRNPPTAFNSSSQSVQSALSTHSHHHHRSPPQAARLPSPQPSSPPAQGLASSMKFLDQINRLKDHYDAKDDGQLSHVPQRKPSDYARTPLPAQVELRRPQTGQPHLDKHRRVSPSSSVERIGDGYQPHPNYPASTAHAAQRLSPRSTHGAFHALRSSSPPPPLPRPLVHSDPYLAPHSYQAANNSFRSPSPPREHSTPPQQIHTQSTLNSGGERARRQYEFANLSLSYPLPISPPDHEWEEEEEEEDQVDTRNAQRLESLTGALNNFLSVIEKCTEISESADLAVSRLDHNMSRLDQRSHRKILTSAERAADLGDRRSRSRERSDSLASTGKSASFAPQLSFYEPAPPPPPSAPATLARYNSFRNSSNRLHDDVYDAKYVDNYEDSDEEGTGANQSRAGSMRPRSRSNSNANVFDSTTSITREPVHTKHFLSPSVKPALTQFGRADSTHSLTASNSFRNGNITSGNNYFKAGLGAPLPPNSPGGLNIGSRSVISKSPAAVRKPEGLPARKAPVPVQNSRKMNREDAEPRRATRTDRATSFASTIGSVVSGLSSVGGGETPRAAQRPTNFTADLRRSADSDSILIDGRVHALRPKSSQGLLSILRQDSNDSEWTNNSRGRHGSGNSRASSPTASQRSRSNSRSRSRSGSPRAGSPVEILSKNKNATVYSFRKDASPRKAF